MNHSRRSQRLVSWLAPAVLAAVLLVACDDTAPSTPLDADTHDDPELVPDGPLDTPDAVESDLSDGGDGDADGPALEDAASADLDGEEAEADLAPAGVAARFEDLGGDDFYRLPWPLDARTLAGGHPDLSDFPGPRAELLDDWLALIEREVVGFAALPVIYVGFTGALDPASLPDPPESLAENAAVRLFSLQPGSCGRAVPLRVEFAAAANAYRAENVLMAAPLPGFPLTPGAWALVATTALRDLGGEAVRPAAGVAEALAGTHPEPRINVAFDPLRDCLDELELGADLAVATVFTVQDGRAELWAVRQAVMDPEATPAPEIDVLVEDASATEPGRFRSWAGVYDTPIYQRGEPPYSTAGGGFVFGSDGRPEIQRWEAVPFLVTVPFNGDGPFPLLIWMDGTGASLRHHLGGEPMREALEAGMAVVSFTPQFTDARAVEGSDPSVHGFNWVNGEAGRTVFRQQAVDTSYFIRVLREALPDEAAPPELDASRLVYAGQSQGSLIGAFLAGVEPAIAAFGLNGTGGYLSATIAERKDPVDYARLLQLLLRVPDTFDVLHPVVQLLQLGGETVDPMSYVRSWSGWDGNPSGAHLLVLNGDLDPTTPRTLVDAMIVGGDLAPVAPAGWDPEPWGVWPRDEEDVPLQGNRQSVDGSPLTRAAVLAAGQGHFTVYDVPAARRQLIGFLSSSFAGVPVVPAE